MPATGVSGVDLYARDANGKWKWVQVTKPATQEVKAEIILNTDRKEFSEHDWKISISQIEELGLEALPPRIPELRAQLATLCREKELDFACLIVTDIMQHHSILLTAGHPAIIEGITYPSKSEGIFEMQGVVSRKKQFFPFISRVLAKAVRT